MVRTVEKRWRAEAPAAIKIRWDGDRTRQDHDIPGDIAKAKAVRKLVGDDFPSAFDANNQYSVGGAIRVGRALEDLGFVWFEEPVQHYDVRAMGEVAQRLDITVSAAEQTYTTQALVDMINAGVRMVQPDIVKMGGITGLMQCAAICFAHGVELVPHQTQPRHRPRRQPARAGDADAQHQAGRVRRPRHADARGFREPADPAGRHASR